MPIICGNIFDSNLSEIYFKNETFLSLRNCTVPKVCMTCKYSAHCKGGAKCQSYAIFGDFNKADPGCPVLASLANE